MLFFWNKSVTKAVHLMRLPGTQKKNEIAVLILWGSGLARWVPQYADVPQGGRLWWGSAVCMFLKKEERIWCTGAGTPAAVFLTLCFAYSLMELGPDEEYVCYCQTRNAPFVCVVMCGCKQMCSCFTKQPWMLHVVFKVSASDEISSTSAFILPPPAPPHPHLSPWRPCPMKTLSLHIRVLWCISNRHVQSSNLQSGGGEGR